MNKAFAVSYVPRATTKYWKIFLHLYMENETQSWKYTSENKFVASNYLHVCMYICVCVYLDRDYIYTHTHIHMIKSICFEITLTY